MAEWWWLDALTMLWRGLEWYALVMLGVFVAAIVADHFFPPID